MFLRVHHWFWTCDIYWAGFSCFLSLWFRLIFLGGSFVSEHLLTHMWWSVLCWVIQVDHPWVSGVLLLCNVLFSGTLSHKLGPRWSTQTLSSASQHRSPSSLAPSALWPGISLKDKLGPFIRLTSFPPVSIREHCLLLRDVQYFEKVCFQYFAIFFGCFRWKNKVIPCIMSVAGSSTKLSFKEI